MTKTEARRIAGDIIRGVLSNYIDENVVEEEIQHRIGRVPTIHEMHNVQDSIKALTPKRVAVEGE